MTGTVATLTRRGGDAELLARLLRERGADTPGQVGQSRLDQVPLRSDRGQLRTTPGTNEGKRPGADDLFTPMGTMAPG